ncbi:hypothetical protein A2704_05350 [Candidatus Kaiserbacteria bacterium RIFCSPHIGHO2_01_FULL_54_36b]|uniref:YgjP-like metallopeptidase domain-containing protein n=1 Tax=Candidatus Kaiserbacteria bacterium RIFCSPHIGHO2_01_FULL_54_36b TaxID=1798483 RepID=A0A1F6CN99_9BACT|nr:MAG: hypothetical protein A2704_05350 [Candidatus Kaiserbacteria bacterium RIFCSPHIGHO2_01_FULL_54_36b]
MSIEYTLKPSARARTMRLTVFPDARVVVTTPRVFAHDAVQRFIAKHAAWIGKHLKKARGREIVYISRREIAGQKQRALAYARARCSHFCATYGFTYNKISIRAQKSRWGSCSQKGNLSFNYKIAALSPHMRDYIIVHELCHLAEMNHSKRFWDLVARAIPHHKEIRRELRKIAVVCQ